MQSEALPELQLSLQTAFLTLTAQTETITSKQLSDVKKLFLRRQ
jgi:hypothetical protein